MVRRWGMVAAILLTFALTLTMYAQEKDKLGDSAKPAGNTGNFYKLTLSVREMDGNKTVSSRSYDFSQQSANWASLRVGSRVPIMGPNNTFIRFEDVGLNVDSRIEDRDNQAAFGWRFELTSLASEAEAHPVIRTVKSDGQTLLAMSKPTVLATVDDLNSTHKFVFEVTATRIK